MRMRTFLTMIAAILTLLPMDAWAKPEVKVAMTAEKEIAVVESGQTVVKRIAADTVESGQTIFYTLTVTNSGDEKATNVVLNNPVPEGTAYVANSAYGKGTKLDFSADGGTTFDIPSRLTIEVKLDNGTIKKQVAGADQYTHIRWTISDVPANNSLTFGYQVSVK